MPDFRPIFNKLSRALSETREIRHLTDEQIIHALLRLAEAEEARRWWHRRDLEREARMDTLRAEIALRIEAGRWNPPKDII